MLNLTLAGNLGRDAESKSTQDGTPLCTFSVGVSTGYGERKTTTWVDVTKWGKGADGLARILRKGSKVAVSGEMSTREHNGKTYIQCRADHVTILGTPEGGQRTPDGSRGAPAGYDWNNDPEDRDIPFARNDTVW